MIAFKPIELEDKAAIQQYTLHHQRRNCDLSFVNLYGWRFLYRTEWAELNGFLLFRFYVDEELAYMMPIGEGDVAPVIHALMEDARAEGAAFRMLGVCVDLREKLEEAFPGSFVFTSDRDYADYIYLRSDLAGLRGKKYQPKRNHINKFKSSYAAYEYKPLTPELIPECLRLEAQWCRANNCAENEALVAERQFMTRVLEHMSELNLVGGVLSVDERIVAFTFGAPINQETFDVCVEKADVDIEGAYPMINCEFVNHIPESFIYVNREEDLGLEGLRKAKLSYQPTTILEKYIVTLR